MQVHKKVIAIIPARKNSKRVKNKNIIDFNGKPMIYWTIKAARESKIFDRIVVSTDSEKIAKISKRYGAEVPFLRSNELADSKTHVEKATLDCLIKSEKLFNIKYSYVCQLMPNAPLRSSIDIRNAYKDFKKNNYSSQISCIKPAGHNLWWSFKMNKNKKIFKIFPQKYSKRSQDLDELYCPTGAIWFAKSIIFKKKKTFFVDSLVGYEIDWVNGIDIDTQEDLKLARFLSNRKN